MRVESSFEPHSESNRRSHDAIHHTPWSNPNPTMQHRNTNTNITSKTGSLNMSCNISSYLIYLNTNISTLWTWKMEVLIFYMIEYFLSSSNLSSHYWCGRLLKAEQKPIYVFENHSYNLVFVTVGKGSWKQKRKKN